MATDLTNLTASIGLTARASAEKAIDLADLKEVANLTKVLPLAFGTGAGKADQIWHDRRTLIANGEETIDLAGALTNAFGQTITFANVKAILLINRSDEVLPGHPVATAAELSILPGLDNFNGPFADASDKLTIPPGGILLVTNPTAAGWPVTPDTGDEIDIENYGPTEHAIYDLFVIGESA